MPARRFLTAAILATAATLTTPTPAAALNCQVSAPISAAELNATNPPWPWFDGQPGTWSFSVTGATPNAWYVVNLEWQGSDNPRPNADIDTGPDGNGVAAYPRYYAQGPTVPGHLEFFDPLNPISGYVAEPGVFSVHIYPSRSTPKPKGTANCAGEVLP
jgi:hypothetical protein